ncbi:MAG: UDP-N-acetylmuramate--L-alanine ligase [Chlorobi bacterium]|nr:UDP-N-acetylmuramate--L-alanine ligase [Chlorobiota bacterium]
MDLSKVNNLYFLGIGGIGMSALARYFSRHGKNISGYDLTPTPLTSQLEKEGMQIHFTEDVSKIPHEIDLVVYTPAIPSDNKEFVYLQQSGIPLMKRARILGQLTNNYFTIAIAGTHGKTSISAMTAHIFNIAGKKITALVGGLMNNYKSNVIINIPADILLVEADEFDRSFLEIQPDISVISSLDADHLDIYKDKQKLVRGFLDFARKLPKEGLLIHHNKLKLFDEIPVKKICYGLDKEAEVSAENIRIEEGAFVFDLASDETRISGIRMAVPGYHYVENALAAATVCLTKNVTPEDVKRGLETFKGVERRFDFRIRTGQTVFIDDYAHHPEEIRATIRAVRSVYPDKKVTVVFQPHLFSRTRDFAGEFAGSLEVADEIILLPVYPAREKPIPGIDSSIILDRINNPDKKLFSTEQLLKYLKRKKPELLLTLGAGDIGMIVPEIEKILRKR